MKEKINSIKEEILEKISKVKKLKDLKNLETFYLGRKGEFTKLLRGLSALPSDQRAFIGKFANEVKNEIQKNFKTIQDTYEGDSLNKEGVDVTLPGIDQEIGHLHPITQFQYEMEDVFNSLGFMILDGPELESDYFNFEAINIPPHHPARDTQDTFYIDRPNKKGENDLVMRTHTSSVQVRAMLEHGAPIRAIVPGRVFRCEATDARHEHTFYQVEGFMIGRDINF